MFFRAIDNPDKLKGGDYSGDQGFREYSFTLNATIRPLDYLAEALSGGNYRAAIMYFLGSTVLPLKRTSKWT
jgi:hypothetical protein